MGSLIHFIALISSTCSSFMCLCFALPPQANRAISAIGFVTAAAGAFSLLGLLRSRSRERQY